MTVRDPPLMMTPVTVSRLERKEQLVAREKADPTATTVGVEATDGGGERERAYHGGRGARRIEGGSTGMIDGGGSKLWSNYDDDLDGRWKNMAALTRRDAGITQNREE